MSLQSALAFYGVIPEHVPVVTSVGQGRPETLHNPLGGFQFNHLTGTLFFDYSRMEVAARQFAFVASPEKALLDLVYLTPGADSQDYLRELRLRELGGDGHVDAGRACAAKRQSQTGQGSPTPREPILGGGGRLTMKEYLRQLTAQADNDLARGCLVREYLQARVLESLQDEGVFLRWAFVGGTALRFLFVIPRFSEDSYFSLLSPRGDPGFRPILDRAQADLRTRRLPGRDQA